MLPNRTSRWWNRKAASALAAALVLLSTVPSLAKASPIDEGNSGASTAGLWDVSYGNGTFVAVGNYGRIVTSALGEVWTARSSPTTSGLRSVASCDTGFVAVGLNGAITTSLHGYVWKAQKSPTNGLLQGVACGKAADRTYRHVAIGVWGNILVSEDGADWNTARSGTSVALTSVAYGKEKFVAVGAGETILYSENGTKWQQVHSGKPARWINDVTFGKGLFVAVGRDGLILISVDGRNWSQITAPTDRTFTTAHYSSGEFMAIDLAGNVYTSPDGAVWTATRTQTDTLVHGLTFGGGQFVSAGELGARTVPCMGPFADVPGNSDSCTAIRILVDNGIVHGDGLGYFHPDALVTRAELVKMLIRALGIRDRNTSTANFGDVDGHWVVTQGYLYPAVQLNAIHGIGWDRSEKKMLFDPDGKATRAQAIKVIAASLNLRGDLPDPCASMPQDGIINAIRYQACRVAVMVRSDYAPYPQPYRDVSNVDWFADWVRGAHKYHLIGPIAPSPLWSADVLAGHKLVTRAEAAQLIANLLSLRGQ